MNRAVRLKAARWAQALLGGVLFAVCQLASAQSSIFSYPNGFANAANQFQIGSDASAFSGSQMQLTSGAPGRHEAGAVWYIPQVNIASFTSDFTFQLASGQPVPSIIAITFCIQNSNDATNPSSEGLGFGTHVSADANMAGYGSYWYPSPVQWQYPVGNSVAIKFDMNSANGNTTTYASGGSPNAVGLYVDGGPSAGLVPENDLNPSGVNLYSGHVMAVHVVYDGSLLTLTLRDTVSNAQTRMSWPINIPAIVGGNTAWVGFTAGEIPAAVNSVLSWSFSQGYAPRLATPTFNVNPGSYSSTQSVSILGPAGATIYYTTNGQQPTTSSNVYNGPISVTSSQYIQAVAVQSGYTDSLVASGNYQIAASGTPIINFPNGFANAGNLMSLVGVAAINGSNLQVNTTTSGILPAGAAWYVAPVSVASFTTNFTIQIPSGANYSDTGMTFCIQNQPLPTDFKYNNAPPSSSDGELRWASGGPTSLANSGIPNGFGYSGTTGAGTYSELTGLTRSVAVVFNSNSNSTGLYQNAADVTQNAISLGGLSLTSGHLVNVSLSYNGSILTMTAQDASTSATYSKSWNINIPSVVGGNTAYVGFTAGSYYADVQQVTAWTWSSAGQGSTQPAPAVPMAPTNVAVH
jgi:hypothetical protein